MTTNETLAKALADEFPSGPTVPALRARVTDCLRQGLLTAYTPPERDALREVLHRPYVQLAVENLVQTLMLETSSGK